MHRLKAFLAGLSNFLSIHHHGKEIGQHLVLFSSLNDAQCSGTGGGFQQEGTHWQGVYKQKIELVYPDQNKPLLFWPVACLSYPRSFPKCRFVHPLTIIQFNEQIFFSQEKNHFTTRTTNRNKQKPCTWFVFFLRRHILRCDLRLHEQLDFRFSLISSDDLCSETQSAHCGAYILWLGIFQICFHFFFFFFAAAWWPQVLVWLGIFELFSFRKKKKFRTNPSGSS